MVVYKWLVNFNKKSVASHSCYSCLVIIPMCVWMNIKRMQNKRWRHNRSAKNRYWFVIHTNNSSIYVNIHKLEGIIAWNRYHQIKIIEGNHSPYIYKTILVTKLCINSHNQIYIFPYYFRSITLATHSFVDLNVCGFHWVLPYRPLFSYKWKLTPTILYF